MILLFLSKRKEGVPLFDKVGPLKRNWLNNNGSNFKALSFSKIYKYALVHFMYETQKSESWQALCR